MTQELRVHHNEPRQTNAANTQIQRGRRTPLFTPFDEIERLFDDLVPSTLFRLSRSPITRNLVDNPARTPSVDLIERDNEIVLRAEVPGIDKEHLDTSVDEKSVTIRGDVTHEEQESEGDYYRCEIARGEFARSVPLPFAIDADKARASLKDGVLELVMPKLEGSKRRKIKIK
ncbi:heat shock protein Hsp20 [Ectothiorhodospira sp. PHS-1]|uniref:Hsp20/alpha crystallin family protein n=1 Tax=Ectothiorhodospira sp. PHS-1 TaxID=519989 RepID=UPI00024A89FF|nr:Hsp20/alpha crystallin family protein [Ectothiorhodospira sp. PHS-1]EHQ53670.1 heat shock protein Hsp20 [Ectothiorhodospira sp. PHS-1]